VFTSLNSERHWNLSYQVEATDPIHARNDRGNQFFKGRYIVEIHSNRSWNGKFVECSFDEFRSHEQESVCECDSFKGLFARMGLPRTAVDLGHSSSFFGCGRSLGQTPLTMRRSSRVTSPLLRPEKISPKDYRHILARKGGSGNGSRAGHYLTNGSPESRRL
jgi:hypothetical protein